MCDIEISNSTINKGSSSDRGFYFKASREWQKLIPLVPENETFEVNHPGETPLWFYWKEFVISRWRYEKSIVTMENVRDTLRFLIRHTSFQTIEMVNNANEFGDMLLDLKEARGQSLTTRNTHLKNVRTYFIWLEKRGYIEKDNTKKIERPPEKRKEQKTLSEEEVSLVIRFIQTHNYSYKIERKRDLFYVFLLMHTGARPSEINRLKTGCIQKNNGSWKLILDSSKQKSRIRPYHLPGYIIDAYREYMIERARINPPFENLLISRCGKPLGKSGIKQILKRISKGTGIKVNAYGFRRFVASKLDQAGCDLKEIGRYLGHTRTSTTELYIERSINLTKNASDKMEGIANSMNEVQSTSTSVSSNKQDKL